MPLAVLVMLAQAETRATQPTFFYAVFLILLIAGAVGWLVAAVLGFARARAFGSSARWFTLSAVCLLIYHLHWLVAGILGATAAAQPNPDLNVMLSVGAFINLFVVLGGVYAIIGFVRLTTPR